MIFEYDYFKTAHDSSNRGVIYDSTILNHLFP